LLIPLAVVILLGVTIWSFYPVARIQYQEAREKARLEAELDELKERNAQLRVQVDRLKTPAGVEEIARESLGMVKDGEHVYIVTNLLEETSATPAGCTSITEPPQTFSQMLLDSVFGIEE
jgi:cell division protein FtsL